MLPATGQQWFTLAGDGFEEDALVAREDRADLMKR
jgi:hypothetical protein